MSHITLTLVSCKKWFKKKIQKFWCLFTEKIYQNWLKIQLSQVTPPAESIEMVQYPSHESHPISIYLSCESHPISIFCYPTNQTNFIYPSHESHPISIFCYPDNPSNFICLSRESHDIMAYFSYLERQILWDEFM